MKVTVEGNSIFMQADNGQTFEVREWSTNDPDAGHLKDGETYDSHDGCAWTRRGVYLVITEPAQSKIAA